MNRIRFSAFAFEEADLASHWRRCLRFRPRYLYGYTSMLSTFARFLLDRSIDGARLGLKVVVTTAEVLSEEDRRVIEGVFGCPVQNEYGCGEVGPIAYECPAGSLHVMADNVFIEVVTDSGRAAGRDEVGEVLVTDLNNRVMPLIRYRIGDRAAWGGPCVCGRPFPVLEKVHGRAYDFVESPDGRRYHGEFFMYLFEEMRDRGIGVARFQVHQGGVDRLEVRLLTEEVGGEQRSFVQSRLSSALPGMQIAVRAVSEIPRASSGKTRLIIRSGDA